MSRNLFLSIVTVILLVVIGCGSGEKSAAPYGGKPLKLAVIPKGTSHEFWKSVHFGAEKAAKELGIRLENLKMVIFRGRRKIFRGMERSLASLAGQQAVAASAVLSLGRGTRQAAASASLALPRVAKLKQVLATDCDHLTRKCNGSKLVCDHAAQGV